ncbi:DUF3280 domain-containing protein [uncultured Roseobacter sp.]|uniref:DUF3280 domain-containing protein n=1 Tax=uncultured Roseobacter sp. TaxID=114847 RepID=UPI002607C351|nr:DUF3280 domain-containing protein [uncultured Roseobacter sp.]
MRLILLIFLLTSAAAQAEDKVAFFGIFLLDSSLQTTELGQDPAEQARLEMLNTMVAERFAAEGYAFVDLQPAAGDIDRYVNLAKCYGCDSRIAQKLGADFSLVGEVQKTSDLIIAMNLQLRSAGTGDLVRGGVVDIRGNTDDTWRRGMRYILNNRIFTKEAK